MPRSSQDAATVLVHRLPIDAVTFGLALIDFVDVT